MQDESTQSRQNEASIEVRVMDLPDVLESLETARALVERLRAERDEWENRYEELLARCGGTMP
jgi:hypothetical protein